MEAARAALPTAIRDDGIVQASESTYYPLDASSIRTPWTLTSAAQDRVPCILFCISILPAIWFGTGDHVGSTLKRVGGNAQGVFAVQQGLVKREAPFMATPPCPTLRCAALLLRLERLEPFT